MTFRYYDKFYERLQPTSVANGDRSAESPLDSRPQFRSRSRLGALKRPTHLHFDYRLIQGAPKSTNALRILEFLGFPDGIIRDAEREHRRATGTAADPGASGQ